MGLLAALFRPIYDLYEEIWFRLFHGPVFHRFLNHKYSYYTSLPWSKKLKFLRLVRDHYNYFEFIPRNNMKLTRAVKALICCGASQLVFSLSKKSLTYFEKIIVYPDYYNSKYTHKRHKGEVNPAFRLIVFSWRGVMEGLDRPDDGLNLMLHEFAHALWLEHKLVQHQYTVLDEDWIGEFEKLAKAEMKVLQADEQHFFRRYAFESMEEFFAVAVENFFERPENFFKQLPHLYNVLTEILKQDPLQITKEK
ncbi:MAG: zinc-dependent peptidase [Bacteroidia bacterium]|nr:zinc-dependent peptidase [Bacteroidia bacterium]